MAYRVGRFIILAWITHLVLNGSWLNHLFFFSSYLFYHDVSDHGHHHFLTFAAPSPNIFWFYFTIAVGAWSLVLQPAIDALVMKVMTTLGHKERIWIKANGADLLRLIFERFGIPKKIWIIFPYITVIPLINFNFDIGWISSAFLFLSVDLVPTSSHSHNCTQYCPNNHAKKTADGRQNNH